MALRGGTVITATKILDGKKKAYTYNGTGKDVTLITANIKAIYPIGASDEDSLYEMNDGTLLWGVESFDDTTLDISATDNTGS
ncbi:MAG TPA: hypothetical protein VGD26_07295 [Chitinophagaceae bacterium]